MNEIRQAVPAPGWFTLAAIGALLWELLGGGLLVRGDSIATMYGVDAYPALVLIDRSGTIVYSSSGLEEKGLEAAVVANLK